MKSLADIKFSILELAPVRDDQSIEFSLRHSLQLAQHAERLGYERFWLAEHHNMDGIASSATAVLLGFIAAHTQHIRLGSGGIMLPNHAPLARRISGLSISPASFSICLIPRIGG